MDVVTPSGGSGLYELELGLLNLLALGLLAVALAAWAAGDARRRRYALSAAVSALVIVAVWLLFVAPADIPIEWITIIHEGQGYKTILQLYVRATHAGPNFHLLASLPAGGGVPSLYDIVWLNLLLALLSAVLFLHLAVFIAGPVWGVVWTAVFALNPATFLASFSELPTHMLALYFQAGVVGWAVLTDERPRSRWARLAAAALCATVTVLAGCTRSEVGLIGITALGVYALHALAGPARWQAARDWLLEVARAALAWLAARPGTVALLGLLSIWFTQVGLPGISRSVTAGLYPFNPALFSLPLFLPMMLLPVAVSIAVVAGFVYALWHFRRFGGLALSLFIIVRTYFAAQDQYYETGRYLSYVLPAVFLLGLYGTTQFGALLAGWRPVWAQLARVLFILAWFTRALPGIPDFYLRPPGEYAREHGFAQVLLDRNSQREVRHLLQVTRAHPECVFVARVIENYMRREGEPRHYAYAFFGAPMREPAFVSERDASLPDAIAHVVPDASCVRLYRGGDCNLVESDGCPDFTAGRQLLEEERFWSRIYNNPFDYGYAKGDIVLGVYAWP